MKTKYLVLFVVFPLVFSCKNNTAPKTILEKIANAHGIENWNQINSLSYTFNVDRGENHSERSWNWKPKTSIITLNDTISYTRITPIDPIYTSADKKFINDKYWLLAPFNLIWDKDSFTYSEAKNQTTSITGEAMNKLTIVYKNDGGYTPGDAYDFYYKDDYIIKEWVFRKANTSKPSLVTSWEDYETIQGLKISKMRKNKTGNFQLSFSNLK